MNEITKKALALINQVEADRGFALSWYINGSDIAEEALCRAVEQHEAYKQRVSAALAYYRDRNALAHGLRVFIIPKPPVDPLEDVLDELDWRNTDLLAKDLREALAKRGLKIVETGR